ncbi:MAG TPA: hypothetical protein VK956_16405, partial [Verrucomicrobium sp.]|nr:hypothetical protein [Verrucomicrobium sp.]
PELASLPGAIALGLLTGWYRHFVGAAPMLVPEWKGAAGLASLLAVTFLALHLILRSFGNKLEDRRGWPLSRTVSLMGMALILFATTCASVGILHHTAWMFGGKATHDVSRGIVTHAMSNVRQLATAVHIYAQDHDGRYPEELGALVKDEILEPQSLPRLNKTNLPGEVSIPFIYLTGLKDSDAADLPMFVTPFPYGSGRYIVAYNDRSVVLVSPEKYAADLQRWREHRAGQPPPSSPPP